jgi:hypothetical protein
MPRKKGTKPSTEAKLPVVTIRDRDWAWVSGASEGNAYAQARLADLLGWDGDNDQLAKVRELGFDYAIVDIEIDGSVYASYKVK